MLPCRERIGSFGITIASAILTAAILGGAGCGRDDAVETPTPRPGVEAHAERDTLRIAHVNWADGIALAYLSKAVLEAHLDYDVVVTRVDADNPLAGVAAGEHDLFVGAWLPITHREFTEQHGDRLADLGALYEGARIGLVCPAHVEIDDIPALGEVAERFDRRIFGIDADTEIMRLTQHALDTYDLDFELESGSPGELNERLLQAADAGDWVVATGWKPHANFARSNLKFLADPRGIYGPEENLHALARANFESDHPRAAALLRSMHLTDRQLGSLMAMIEEAVGGPAAAAGAWTDSHAELVQSWLAGTVD